MKFPLPEKHKNIHAHRFIYLNLIIFIFCTWVLLLIKLPIKLDYLFYQNLTTVSPPLDKDKYSETYLTVTKNINL